MNASKLHITTERLQLTPFTLHETSLFHTLNTDPFVRKFLWDDEIISRDTAEEIMIKNEQHFNDDYYGLWKMQEKEREEVMGYVGLWYFFNEPQPQLLYAILEEYTKKGYATEASLAIIEYAFHQLGFEYLIAATDEPHRASQRVAERLGMVLVEKRIENGKPTLFYRIDKAQVN